MLTSHSSAGARAVACQLLLCCVAGVAFSQDVDRDVLVRSWERSSAEQKISAIIEGFSAESSESRALALSGIARLAIEDRQLVQQRFPASSIRPFLQDADAEVVRQAARAYVAISNSDEAAELEIVAAATSGRSTLRPWEYVRYLRPMGITSDAARMWLTSLAQGPVSEDKYSAVEVLVNVRTPPAFLLPHVMELIRSPQYFCSPNLLNSLPGFGRPAEAYVSELTGLRAKLEAEGKLPVDSRTVVLVTEPEVALSILDEAIAALSKGIAN